MTDETVGVEPGTCGVHPYPRPLPVRASDADWPKSEHGPDSLGLLAAHPAPQLSALLVLRRDPAVTSPVWSRLDLFDAITTLSPETSSLSRLNRPLPLLKILHRDPAGSWPVEYAEAEQIVDRVGALVEDS